LNIVWFVIMCFMLVVYAVLDGFDLGVGAILPFVAKTPKERDVALASIGPVWNGNETWLLAAGGAMVAAFPRLYAVGFSGFYLALILVLWLFILRGVGYEFHHFEKSNVWRAGWETSFFVSSLLLTVLFGVAVGNILRGVPLNSEGIFQGSFAFLLNPFAILCGVLTAVILVSHGSAYLSLRTQGALQERARRIAVGAGFGAVLLTVLLLGVSGLVRSDFLANFIAVPILWALPLLATISLIGAPVFSLRKAPKPAFTCTCAIIVSMLGTAVAGLFPKLLPSISHNPALDLTVWNAHAPMHSLISAFYANIVVLVIVICYTTFVYRTWMSKPLETT
jgi:cytochrome d ubiquinol oxidase subunit II